MTRVKICGVASLRDLRLVAGCGADAVGVITGIPSSPRCVSPETAETLIDEAPVFTKTVLVTAPRNIDEAIELVKHVRPDAIQIHGGDIDVKELSLAIKNIDIIKPVSADDSQAESAALKAAAFCDAVLLDSSTGSEMGGTGKTYDWEISRRVAEAIKPRPLILAGGLAPGNVAEAIHRARPYAVDVCTGTEASPRVKDPEKVRRFLRAVDEADRRHRA